MGHAFLYGNGNGSTNLNLNIRTYASADDLPSVALENTIAVITDTLVSNWDFTRYQPALKSLNRNLLCYPYADTSDSVWNVDWVDNGDGTISAQYDGTSVTPHDVRFYLSYNASHRKYSGDTVYQDFTKKILLRPGVYTLSGCPSGGGDKSYYLEIRKINFDTYNLDIIGCDFGHGFTFTVDIETIVFCYAVVVVPDCGEIKVTFKPQLERGDKITTFIPGNADGQIWVRTGKFLSDIGEPGPIDFNVLRQNSIMIYPQSIKQYENGVWNTKNAKIYKNGSWVDLPI